VLQQFEAHTQVSYILYYTSFGISPREFVEYRQTQVYLRVFSSRFMFLVASTSKYRELAQNPNRILVIRSYFSLPLHRLLFSFFSSQPVHGGTALLAKSCFHAMAPPRKDRTRGETIYSGYIFRDVPAPASADASASSAKRCQLVGIVQQSYGANLPARLVSSLNSKVIGGWVQHFVHTLLKQNAERGAGA